MTIKSDSGLNKVRRSTVTKTFCVLSCLMPLVWIFLWRDETKYDITFILIFFVPCGLFVFACLVFLFARKKYDDGILRADFQMTLTAEQWFSMNYWPILDAARSKSQCAFG
jgi:hypothetical protein